MALNRDGIIDVVLSRLGNRNDDTVLLAAAKKEIVLVQSELEAEPFLPWFLISSPTDFTLVNGQNFVTLVDDFIREYEDEDVYYRNTANSPVLRKLEKLDVDDLTNWQNGVADGEPRGYAIVGQTFALAPTPDAAAAVGTLRTRYYQRGATLSDSQLTNSWTLNADWILTLRLGEVMARQYTRDIPLADGFKEKSAIAYGKLMAAHVAREQANRKAQMGGFDR